MNYSISITQTAADMIRGLEQTTRSTVLNKIRDLRIDPEKRGKPLKGDLEGYRSIHAAGRYRIIYTVDNDRIIVYIVGAGIRKEGSKKDIYQVMKKLLRAKLID